MSAARPAVSAIIVSYNRGDDLRLAIQALVDTEYQPLQIVVVDNASVDNAADIAASFSQVTLIRSRENVGFAQGCNIGLQASKGAYVALINNDAVVAKDWVDKLVEFLEQHPEAAAAAGKIYDWNEKNPLGLRSNGYHSHTVLSFNTGAVRVERNTPDTVREVPTLSGACVMIRRSAITQLGEPFLEPLFFTYYEETDFFVRARRQGWKLYYTAEPVAWHRVRGSGTPYGYLFHMERNRMLFAYRNFPLPALALALAATLWRAIKSVFEQVILGKPVLKPRSDAWRWLIANRIVLNSHRRRVAGQALASSFPGSSPLPASAHHGRPDLNMLVSIVIDNYNQGQFLADAIESALDQAGPCEVIVVDDGSTDDSKAVLDRYRSRVTIIEKANGGQASALSAGVLASRGDVVCLLDADDVFEKQKAQRVRQVFLSQPWAEWCFHRYHFCGSDLTPLARPPAAADKPVPQKNDYRADIESGSLPYLPTGICGMSFRRSLVTQLFPMPSAPGIALSDNYLKFLALSLARGLFIPDRLARQRIHGGNRYTNSKARATQRALIGTCTAYHLANKNPHTVKFCRRMFMTTASRLQPGDTHPEVIALRDQFIAEHLGPFHRLIFRALQRVFGGIRLKLLARLLIFSPEGRVFFWATALLHIALKVLLGLSAVTEDRYGFHSLLAPPQSFALAAGDIGVCFLLTRLFDWAIPAARRRVVFTGLLWAVCLFLIANFIVHCYFKSFVNRGLMAFNGAPLREIIDYAVAGANRYTLGFIAFATACAVGVSIFYSRLLQTSVVTKRWLPVLAMVLDVLPMAYISQLNQGQVGFMALNPAYVIFTSYLTLGNDLTPRATPEQAQRFVDPKGPVFGHYDNDLDITDLRRPHANVLFVLIESLPLEQTPLGGASGGLTVLQELADNGINFSNFRSVFPATSRSFLTYHCGVYPSVGLSTATRYLPNYNCESLLDVVKGAGYRTGFFTAPMFNYDNLGKSAVAKGYQRYEDFLTLKKATNALDAPAVPEEAVVDSLLDFVTHERDRPFFATYFMFWDHAPYRLPFEDISNLAPLERYHRTLTYLDKSLRDALSRMQQAGLLENTVVIVAADHGEGFALHHDNVNHSGHIYEDDVKIPFLIHLPNLGRHATARQSSNVDFAPTVAALLDLPRPPSWQGQDLLSSSFTPGPTMLYGRASFATIGLVDGNYKYIEYIVGGSTALYDLASDPHEQTNLIGQFPKYAQRYQSLLKSWLPVVEQRSWAVSGF